MKYTIKRTLAYVLVFLFLFTQMGMVAFGDEPIIIGATDEEGTPGEEVTVYVTMTANSNSGAATIDLKYDNTRLEFVDGRIGKDLVVNSYDVFPDAENLPGPDNDNVRLVYNSLNGYKGSGEIMEVVFTIKADAFGVIPLNVHVVELVEPQNYADIGFTVQNGSITVNKAYTVTFDSQGGSPVADGHVNNGDFVVKPDDPVLYGNDFLGWHREPAGMIPWDFDNEPMPVEDITLYAKWQLKQYDVVFDTDGGSTVDDQIIDHGFAPVVPLAPIKTDYRFIDWYTDTSYSQVYDFTKPITGDTVIYAKWGKIYKVTYYGNNETGGTSPVDPIQYIEGEKAVVKDNEGVLVRDGYTYKGWNTLADGSGDTYTASDEYTIGSADAAFYALWEANLNRLVFDGNTGLGSMADLELKTDQTANLPANSFTKTGYTFMGWNEKADGSGGTFDDESSYTMGPEGVYTLYAQWEINKYEILFNTDGGTPVDSQTVTYGFKVTKPDDPVKGGYRFINWYKDAGFSTVYDFDYAVDDDATIYAKWEKLHGVTYDGNGSTGGSVPVDAGEYTQGESVTVKGNDGTLVRAGYTFGGWNTRADKTGDDYGASDIYVMGTDDVVFYALWIANTNRLEFDANTGTGAMTGLDGDTDESMTLPANEFSKTGYTFDSWNTEADGTGVTYADKGIFVMGPDSQYTLYARWAANMNVLSFDANGGTGAMGDVTLATDSTDTLPESSFTKAGYTFAGWNTEADGTGTPYSDKAAYTMGTDSKYTLHAQWVANMNMLSFDANGGSGAMGDVILATDSTDTLPENSFTRAGYTFADWNTEADGTGTPYSDKAAYTMGTDSKYTLYAQWIAKMNVLSFDANGGSGTMNDVNGATDSVIVLPGSDFTKENYDFTGWNTEADGSGTAYESGDGYTMGPDTSYTLYAQWAIKTYEVKFIGLNGKVLDSQMVDHGSDAVEPTDTTETGYDFGGWDRTFTNITSHIVVNGIYTIKQYQVNFLDYDGTVLKTETVDHGSGATPPDNPVRVGYVFSKWDKPLSPITQDTDIKAVYTVPAPPEPATPPVTQFTVSFDSMGGSTVSSANVNSGSLVSEPADPTREGYAFDGWYRDKSFETSWNFKTDKVSSALTLYAQWKEIIVQPEDTISVTKDENKASASVEEEKLEELLSDARDKKKVEGTGVVKVDVLLDDDIEEVTLDLPGDFFGEMADEGNLGLEFNNSIATLHFDSKAVETISESYDEGELSVIVQRVDKEGLEEEIKEKVGDRPLYDFTVLVNGIEVSDFGGGVVTVTVPYTLKEGENKNSIVVYHITDGGEFVKVEGRYVDELESVVFTTTHFSMFTLGLNEVTFIDVSDTQWFYDCVSYISARNMPAGVVDNAFRPYDDITRAEFLVMVMDAFNIRPDSTIVVNFKDAGNDYYTPYLAVARKMGIAKGVGDDTFRPNDRILRQDMLLLIFRVLYEVDRLPKTEIGVKASTFADYNEISDYALSTVEYFVERGIIRGSGNRIMPKSNLERAEAAQVLYNLLTSE